MSSSVVHLALAAAAGLTLGAGATFALRPAASPARKEEGAFPVPSERSIKAGQGQPPAVYHGGLTGTDLVSRVMDPVSIGELSMGKLAWQGVARLLPRCTRTKLSLDPIDLAGPISDHLRRVAYTTAYDRRNRIPAWTAEHLTAANLKGSGTRSESTFREDQDVPERFRAHLLDYFKSGYGESRSKESSSSFRRSLNSRAAVADQ